MPRHELITHPERAEGSEVHWLLLTLVGGRGKLSELLAQPTPVAA